MTPIPNQILGVQMRHKKTLVTHLLRGGTHFPSDMVALRREWPEAKLVKDEPTSDLGRSHLFASAELLNMLVVPSGMRLKEAVRIWNRNASIIRDNACYVGATDGSGHQDGYGGWACVVRRQVGWIPTDEEVVYEELPTDVVRFGGIFGGTVLRNEMQGLIEAMRAVSVMHANDRKDSSEIPVMLWLTDRADVAHGLMRNEFGDPVTRRSSSADLWAQIVYLSRFCAVVPQLIPRNTDPDQALCDALAGNARKALKAEISHHEKIITQTKLPWNKTYSQKDSR